MFRLGVVLTALWILLLAPALCAGGLLMHPCECGDTDACGHEEECSTDPCGKLTARPEHTKPLASPTSEPMTVPAFFAVPQPAGAWSSSPLVRTARLGLPPTDTSTRPLLL